MNKFVVIVAGGMGTRMKTQVPKQFLYLKGTPILMQTISRFYEFDGSIRSILVLPESQVEYWNQLCKTCRFNISHNIATGGDTRYESVKNGLKLIKEDG